MPGVCILRYAGHAYVTPRFVGVIQVFHNNIKTVTFQEANNKNWFRGQKNCNNFHLKRNYLLLIIVYQTGC